eukprot:TRINITY_DN3966_c0_g1_i2.p1 TRINITY_DN3966_c0_g1~~TRINITY_DN3966_c0_g1_i2.p1  ORF type:complete len:861 (+),score=143.00 TRINITY_DN3966_c0_g1_i2:180-2762(+)
MDAERRDSERVLAPHEVRLSSIINRILRQCEKDMKDLAQRCAKKDGAARKIEFLMWIEAQRQQFIRLLVLVEWALGEGNTEHCTALYSKLRQREDYLTQMADAMYYMRENLLAARAPFYDVSTAVDVLGSGTYLRLPSSIQKRYLPPEVGQSLEPSSVFKRLNNLIYQRLFSSEVPPQFDTIQVDEGTVKCRVDHEFEVVLTLDGPQLPWRLLSLKIFIQGANSSEEVIIPQHLPSLQQFVQSKLQECDPRACLQELFSQTHGICIKLVMNILRKQAQALQERDSKNLKVRSAAQYLSIRYWCTRVTPKGGSALEDAFPCLQLVVHEMNISIHHQPALVGPVSFHATTSSSSSSPSTSSTSALPFSPPHASTSSLGTPLPSVQGNPDRDHSGVLSPSALDTSTRDHAPLSIKTCALRLDFSCLDLESLLHTAIHKFIAARMISLQKILHAETTLLGPKFQTLEVHLYAKHMLIISIDASSGNFQLQLNSSGPQRVVCERILYEAEGEVNADTKAIAAVVHRLKTQAILERIERASGAFCAHSFRASHTPLEMHLSPQCPAPPFDLRSDSACFCRFAPWTEFLLAFVVTPVYTLDVYLLCITGHGTNRLSPPLEVTAVHALDRGVDLPTSSPHVTSIGPELANPTMTEREKAGTACPFARARPVAELQAAACPVDVANGGADGDAASAAASSASVSELSHDESLSMVELVTQYSNADILGLYSFCLELDCHDIKYQLVEQKVSFSLGIPLVFGKSETTGKWQLRIPFQGLPIKCSKPSSMFDGSEWILAFSNISRKTFEQLKQEIRSISAISEFLAKWRQISQHSLFAEFFSLEHVTPLKVQLCYGKVRLAPKKILYLFQV